eukprot:TRINITY_DN32816_c0_g1_i1.p1 TRINITY_DN32816_c0_g1~~TRINITY_DN32816_c0_g1_i1.p1  ORF type:complete len:446 (+),score=203.50 TRINITY_DN32816_c0_g1_i1:42-1340(+)
MGKKRSAGKGEEEVHWEFFGPVGVSCMMVALPVVVYALYFLCNDQGCLELGVFGSRGVWWPAVDLAAVEWLDRSAAVAAVGWFVWLVALYHVLPGKWVKGTETPDGERLDYKCNGFVSGMFSVAVFVLLAQLGWIDGAFCYKHYLGLVTMAVVFSFALSAYLYAVSMGNRETNLASHGNTGVFVYDFFMGRQLNPRIGKFDWKFFCELRPGLFGWFIILISMACAQYQLHGQVTNSMLLVLVFQGWYVIDSAVVESAILTTMDITTDGFGFMLVFGDLAWVPFTYSLQARYLVDHPVQLSTAHVLAIIAVKLVGYYIFRSANLQKDRFRNDPMHPAVRNLRSIPTSRGTKLLCDGWWGQARHINYLGDWLMGVSWCLPCGFDHVLPYFYAVYFGILLVHRERRDDHKCATKYGRDWIKYRSQVPYRIVPYLY